MIEFPAIEYEGIERELELTEPLASIGEASDPHAGGVEDAVGVAETLTVAGKSFPACREHGLLFLADEMVQPQTVSVVWVGGTRLVVEYGETVSVVPQADERLVVRAVGVPGVDTRARALHVVSVSDDQLA